MLIVHLLLLFIISASWLSLYFFRKLNQTILNLLIALGAWSMLSIALVHILTESLESSENAIYAFMGWFLLIYIIEELLTHHQHDRRHEDHTHEDPHEHYDHVALVSFVAIFLHTIFDGLGIRAGFSLSETLGYSILVSVWLHQIPVSLSLAAIFRESKFTPKIQVTFMILFALAAPIGYIISDIILTWLSPVFASLATAFAGGSLLYVATADLLPVIHGQTNKKYLTVLFFVIWVIAMTSIKIFEH